MKKIVFLIESMVVGGAERVLLTLVNNLDPAEYDVTVISAFRYSVYDGYDHQFSSMFKPHVKHRWLCDNSSTLRCRVFNFILHRGPRKLLHRLLVGCRFDVEVAFYEGFPTLFLSHSSNRKSRKIAWLHTDTENIAGNWSPEEKEKQRRAYGFYDRVIAVSSKVAESFVHVFGELELPVVCHNPIDGQEIIRRSQEVDEDLMPRSKGIRLVSVGRLCLVKGYGRLLRVMHRLLQNGHEVELWIIGDGECREELESYIQFNDLQESIKLLGFNDNPYKYMKRCDLFVCSSFAEGFSLVVCEALLLGLPVISTECAGMTDLIGKENTFGVITENSEDGLFAGISDLLMNPEKLKHYKDQAFMRAQNLDIQTSVERIKKVLTV